MRNALMLFAEQYQVIQMTEGLNKTMTPIFKHNATKYPPAPIAI